MELKKAGKGIAFVIPVDKVRGINHKLNALLREQIKENQAE